MVESDTSSRDFNSDVQLYSASLDNSIRCWDLYDMNCLSVIQERDSEVGCILHIPDSNIMCSGHENGCLKLWNIDSGSCVVIPHHSDSITQMTVINFHQQSYVLCASMDGYCSVWDVTKKKAARPQLETSIFISKKGVRCVTFDSHCSSVILGDSNGNITIWPFQEKEISRTLVGHTGGVSRVCVDGNFIISSGEDGTIRLWDMLFGTEISCIQAYTVPIRDLLIIPTSGLVVACPYNADLLVFDYVTQEMVHSFSHDDSFRCILYSETRQSVYVGTDQSQILHVPIPTKVQKYECGEGVEIPKEDISNKKQEGGEEEAGGVE